MDELTDAEIDEARNVAWLTWKRERLIGNMPPGIDQEIAEELLRLGHAFGFNAGAIWNNDRVMKLAEGMAKELQG